MQVDNLIIDGTNLEFRIFYIARSMKTTNDEGEHTSCMFNFLRTFYNLVERFNPTNIYAAWDKKLEHPSTNFRKEILVDQYKAGRTKPPDIQEMYDQEIKLIEMLETLGVKNIYPNVLEADDVCAWLATTQPGRNIVVSVDQDLLQLVNSTTSVYNLKEMITFDNFEEKKGVKVEHFKLYKAIKGDASDNITGLSGYGEVRSRKLASNWSEGVLTEESKLIVLRNLRLIDLHYGYKFQPGERQKYEEQLNYLKNIKCDIEKFILLCTRYNFKSYIENINNWKRLTNRNNIIDIVNCLS